MERKESVQRTPSRSGGGSADGPMNLSTYLQDRVSFPPARRVLCPFRHIGPDQCQTPGFAAGPREPPSTFPNHANRHDHPFGGDNRTEAKGGRSRSGLNPELRGAPGCSKEVLWPSTTAVRRGSTATSTTTHRCSGDGRAVEHGAFNGEGRDLALPP